VGTLGVAAATMAPAALFDGPFAGIPAAIAAVLGLIPLIAFLQWAEEDLFLRMAGRPLGLRIGAQAGAVLAAGLVLAMALVLAGALPALDVFVPWLILGGTWLASASIGTLLVLAIEVPAIFIRSFRRRLTFAFLVIVTFAFALAAGLSILAIEMGEWGKAHPSEVSPQVIELVSRPGDLLVAGLAVAAVIAIPGMLSAASKLAEAAMDRIHPLRSAMDAVAAGERAIALEEGGSEDFVRLAESFNEMVGSLAMAERMERAFGVYVSSQVLERIRLQHGQATIPPSLREATVFFADIRGFTRLSEKLAPGEVLGLLNRYFEKVVAIVAASEGFLNKFIGDAVVVVFNGPIDQPDHAERACRCAITLQEELARLNAAGAFPEIGTLSVGVGIATGPMVAGNVGGATQMEYTVVGDTVNLASRLTGQAGAGEVWVSAGTAAKLPAAMRVAPLPPVSVKGKEQPVTPYRVFP
jgi:class 3 adenylate cyclase